MIPFSMLWQLLKTLLTEDVGELIKVLGPLSLAVHHLLDIPNLDFIQLTGLGTAGKFHGSKLPINLGVVPN